MRCWLGFFVLACALIGCGHTPPPAPVPTTSDVYTSKVFDCHLAVVALERDSATVDAGRCLLGVAPTDCLVGLASTYQPDSVACAVRRLGADANAAVLAGSTDPNDKIVADAARAWFNAERVGLR